MGFLSRLFGKKHRNDAELPPPVADARPSVDRSSKSSSSETPLPAAPTHDKPTSTRVDVGKCEKCERPLRVKQSGVKPTMRLTCRCGHVNVIGSATASKEPTAPRRPGTATRETPSSPTAYCDICGATVQSNALTVVALRQMQQAVRDGFNPYQTSGIDMSRSLAVGRAGGLTAAQLFAEWRRTLMQDTTDWKLCRDCLTAFQRAALDSGTTIASAGPVTAKARAATADEHYILECLNCDFTHHIPSRAVDGPLNYSVDVDDVKLICVYGPSGYPQQFTVTLQVKDFFRIKPVPQSGRVLRASIGDNINPLHSHILSHCDPLYLIIQQSSNRTTHEYKSRPEGQSYVKFSKDHGTDIVGSIDVSKAEIPGVS
jgi:hypothetical protein